ncbi:MAG: hypothetical protein ABI850_07080, partial [Flavobacterium sp.]
LFALLLNGCDDGDITVETVNFSDVASQSCNTTTNELIFKLKSQESLSLQLGTGTFKNEPTPVGDPNEFSIDNTTFRLVYRSYNGTVDKSNICSLIPPTTPNIINEWYAKSGIIEITTTAQTKLNETTGAITITGYTHNIIIKNLTYSLASLDVTQPQVIFGDFVTTLSSTDQLNTTFTKDIKQCGTAGQLYTYNDNSSMTIDNIDPTLIQNVVTAANAPRTGLIGTDVNKLLFKVYTGSALNDNYFCTTTPPATAVLKETWAGVAGVANTSGIIEVTTTTEANTFKHTIRLRNTTLQKTTNKVNLGTSYLLGVFYTAKTN